jgi:LuxR family quorum-sensing system transcriptional regulator CciR
MMLIFEFIEKSNAAASADDVFALYRDALAILGYERIAMIALTPAAQRASSAGGLQPLIGANVPESWLKHYFDRRYHEVDPVLRVALGQRSAILWDQLLTAETTTAKQRQVLLESQEVGLHHGVSIPIHGPRGETFIVSLAASQTGEIDTRCVGSLQVLTTQFHLTYLQRVEGPNLRKPEISLTDRERECLTWTAQGKSAWAISRILGVSEHTVNFHLKGAMKKLSCGNRVQAVVSALNFGLITP